MSFLLKVIVSLIVNIPLLTFLCESFFSGKDADENLTISFGIILFSIYLIQFFLIVLLTWGRINIKRAYPLFILLLFLSFLGIINSNSVFYSIIVYLQYVSVILFTIWLAKEPVQSLKSIVVCGYFASFAGFVSFAVLHFFISNGDFLFTLAQIQLPVYCLLFLFAFKILTVDRSNKFLFYISALAYLLILVLGALRATDLQQLRYQFLPIALFFIILFLLLPKFLRNIILLFLFINALYHYDDAVDIILYRLTSFEERLSIFYLMALDSFYFLVPQGLGASNQLFDINRLTLYAGSTRSLYPPHSGFAAMLFDSSIVFFIFVFIFFYNLFKTIKIRPETKKIIEYFKDSKIPYLTIIIITYLFENIFYLKFSITGATFADDSLYLLIVIYFFYRKAKNKIDH